MDTQIDRQTDRQTDTTKNITYPHTRVVMTDLSIKSPLVLRSDGNCASCLFCDISQMYFFTSLGVFIKENLIKTYFSEMFSYTKFFIILKVAWGHQSEVSKYLSWWSKRLPIFFPKRWAQRFRSMFDCIQFIAMLNASILIKGKNKKCLVGFFESNGLWRSWKCIIYVHLYCTSHVYFICFVISGGK